MADIRPVTPNFAVAPQIRGDDFAQIAAAGYRMVINNRPDGEALDQLSDANARAAAEAAGLAYAFIPISGQPRPEQVEQTSAALAQAAGPTLAYCRSGTRSIMTWALAQAASGQATPDQIVGLAARAGYDLVGLKGALERLARA
jgi:uncharacterized protein (TIGR01244 family)